MNNLSRNNGYRARTGNTSTIPADSRQIGLVTFSFQEKMLSNGHLTPDNITIFSIITYKKSILPNYSYPLVGVLIFPYIELEPQTSGGITL